MSRSGCFRARFSLTSLVHCIRSTAGGVKRVGVDFATESLTIAADRIRREIDSRPPRVPTGTSSSPFERLMGTSADSKPSSRRPPAAGIDQERIARAVREILAAVGEDPDRDGLLETPARVARMYAEMFSGLHDDPRQHLKKFFTEKYDEIVLVRDITFQSMCEHHLLPFMGKAHIAYVPSGRVIGLIKLARVVDVVSRRPQVQERMTEVIADLLVEELGAKGVAVVVEASHSCMTIRGVRKPGSVCVTSAMRGLFRDRMKSRAEVMTLIYGERRME